MGSTARTKPRLAHCAFPYLGWSQWARRLGLSLAWPIAPGSTARAEPRLAHCAFPYLGWSQWARRLGLSLAQAILLVAMGSTARAEPRPSNLVGRNGLDGSG